MNLKTILLETSVFINNEYLDKYIELILTKNVSSHIKFKTSSHHIIPVAYYKIVNKPINNDSTNLVILFNSDHVLAHYYLVLCTKDPLYTKMLLAFNFMINEPNKYKLDTNISNELLLNIDNTIEQARIKLSQINSGKRHKAESYAKAKETFKKRYNVNCVSQLPGVGKKISKTKKGVSTISEKQRQILIATCKKRKGTHLSEDTKHKISIARKNHEVSPITRQKISIKCKGNIPPNKNSITVNKIKTEYISLNKLSFNDIDSVLTYINNNKYNIGTLVVNNKLKNRNFDWKYKKGCNQIKNIKNKLNINNARREK